MLSSSVDKRESLVTVQFCLKQVHTSVPCSTPVLLKKMNLRLRLRLVILIWIYPLSPAIFVTVENETYELFHIFPGCWWFPSSNPCRSVLWLSTWIREWKNDAQSPRDSLHVAGIGVCCLWFSLQWAHHRRRWWWWWIWFAATVFDSSKEMRRVSTAHIERIECPAVFHRGRHDRSARAIQTVVRIPPLSLR